MLVSSNIYNINQCRNSNLNVVLYHFYIIWLTLELLHTSTLWQANVIFLHCTFSRSLYICWCFEFVGHPNPDWPHGKQWAYMRETSMLMSTQKNSGNSIDLFLFCSNIHISLPFTPHCAQKKVCKHTKPPIGPP